VKGHDVFREAVVILHNCGMAWVSFSPAQRASQIAVRLIPTNERGSSNNSLIFARG
jgi:hypothetical protein